MASSDMLTTTTVTAVPGIRPRDEELDLFGLTHPGRVRRQNQDHFLLCTVHPQVVIHGTSLPEPETLPLRGQRLATILLVADGVGSGAEGGDASRLATESITSYLASTLRCYHAADTDADGGGVFADALRQAAFEAHGAVRAESAARNSGGSGRPRRMATTLTMAIAVWPWIYVVQVGDSRCYYWGNGTLRQVTRDQTLAQSLVDEGVLPAEQAAGSPLSHVLSSAIGSEEAMPEVARLDISQRDCVILLCTDGLTKHVTDEQIAEELRTMESSEQVCRALLDLALENGGSDNITVLVGTARQQQSG